MKYQNTFKRYEIKYLLTREQQKKLKKLMAEHMEQDEFWESRICNLYFDTPDYLLIRRSIEKPIYKEKLRLRCYGRASEGCRVFLEIKKKFDHIVYKRRICMREEEASRFLEEGGFAKDSQIAREIRYMFDLYKGLAPRVFISYRREAYKGIEDKNLRITFDDEILYRDWDLDLKQGIYGKKLLPEDLALAEIKTCGGFPLWLTEFLSREKIRKVSFSKYGKAYEDILKNSLNEKGGLPEVKTAGRRCA